MSKNLHIAVDFDKTLAYYESKWRAKQIGHVLDPMKHNILKWLDQGHKVTIFTARVDGAWSHREEEKTQAYNQMHEIQYWLEKNGLPPLPITALKLKSFTHFIDDKAFHVEANTGLIVNCPPELL